MSLQNPPPPPPIFCEGIIQCHVYVASYHVRISLQISCNGHPKSQADAERTDAHSLEHVISDDFKDVHHLLIEDLKPDYNYSCSLMAAAQHDGETPRQLIAPIQFTTLSISTKGKSS